VSTIIVMTVALICSRCLTNLPSVCCVIIVATCTVVVDLLKPEARNTRLQPVDVQAMQRFVTV